MNQRKVDTLFNLLEFKTYKSSDLESMGMMRLDGTHTYMDRQNDYVAFYKGIVEGDNVVYRLDKFYGKIGK